MEEIDILWKKTCQVFNVLDRKVTCHETETEEDFEYIVQHLTKLNFAEDVYQLVLIETRCLLRQEIAPKFWKYFSEDCEDKEGFQKFEAAVAYLRCEYQKCLEIIKKLIIFKQACSLRNAGTVESEQRNLIDCFRSCLLSQLPPNFDGIIHSFYSTAFQIFLNTHQEDDDQEDFLDDIEINCRGCGKEAEFCRCQRVICAFNMTNMILSDMQLLDRLTGFTLTCLVQEKIGMHVNETCKGIFDSSHLEKLETWLDSVVLNWLTRVYNRGSSKIAENDETTKKSIHNFRLRLLYFLYETYANTIIDQFFNIIIDYPDSQPAIDDLKVCLSRLDLRKEFVENLKQSLESRLLHPGVNTTDILTGYVAAIKAIRHLDSSGVLLETITEPVKEYLRKRNDTVREVVTGLTEEGPTDLAEELARSEALKENVDISKQDDMANWESWEPDPVDAKRSAKPSSNSRTADIIAMVVDIYGSKELFVNEYRNLLADRMLSQLDFNPEKEIRNLELLKLRFGEALLRSCEVMIKDIGDSKRINTHIQSDINYNSDKSFEISSLILSSQFWPAFNKETLELPEEIQAEFKKYTTSYEAYKGNRTLSWRNVTGRVNIDIEIGSKTIDLTVTPTQAVIIYHFQTKPVWTLEELSFATRVPQVILRKRIMFWKTQGLLMETETDVYKLVDEGEDTQIGQVQPLEICEDEESESAMASASDQREEELQVFWSYIVGMLTNLDSLPIERIHQMLKMFASHGPGVEFSQDELKNFLQRKVREHKLMFVGGVYHLPK